MQDPAYASESRNAGSVGARRCPSAPLLERVRPTSERPSRRSSCLRCPTLSIRLQRPYSYTGRSSESGRREVKSGHMTPDSPLLELISAAG